MYLDQVQISAVTGRHAEVVSDDFFYSRFVDKNEDSFQQITPEEQFRNKVKDLIREEKEQIASELDDFGDPVSTIAQDVLFPDDAIMFRGPPRGRRNTANSVKYIGEKTEDPVLVFPLSGERAERGRRPPSERSDNFNLNIVAKNAEQGRDFVGYLKSEVYEISKFVTNYAEIEDLRSGGEIVNIYFDNQIDEKSNLTGWYEDEVDDPFEQEVFEAVQELTAVTLSNVRIEVDVGDNPDFDVVALPLGGYGTNYAIEVKDLAQDQNEEVDKKPALGMDSGELRNELIRKPKNYAEEADLDLITVVKGLSDEQYDDLQKLAESSDVVLLNDDNYLDGLHEVLFEQSFREMSDYIS